MNLNLSVVVPCYGRPESTRAMLASLAQCHDEFEVVVVDDASPASLKSVIDEFAGVLDVRYFRQSQNAGPAAARNRGIREARHDLIAFTDNDCVVDPMWPRELGTYLGNASAKIAGVGGRVLARGNDAFSRYFVWHKILDPFLADGRYLYVVTANCAFRRSALESVGGFDERVRHPGGEDPGLCFKLIEAGWALHYRKDAVVRHEFRLGWLDFVRTFYRYGKGCRMQADLHAKTLLRSTNRPVKMALGFGGGTSPGE